VEIAELAEVRVGRALGLRPLSLPHQILHLVPPLLELVDADAPFGKLERIRAGEGALLDETPVRDHEQDRAEEREEPDRLRSPPPDRDRDRAAARRPDQ